MVKKILIAPLNWGLGHATRCIPIIEALQDAGYHVLLASDGAAGSFLQQRFPNLTYFELPSYHIRYPFKHIVWNVIYGLPAIVKAIVLEHQALKKIVETHQIDGLISDNRYGVFYRRSRFFSTKTAQKPPISFFMGHQLALKLNPKTDQLNAIEYAASWGQRHFLSRFFQKILVPDAADDSENLSGVLAHHPVFTPTNKDTIYIGVQSRLRQYFSAERQALSHTEIGDKTKKRILILLSGVEPQRTNLEVAILKQMQAFATYETSLVQGIFSPTPTQKELNTHFSIHSFCGNADELAQKIAWADIIICRSGYSTLMDLAVFKEKKVILIPTIGQTEQLYLAHRLAQQQKAVFVEEASMNLAEALSKTNAIKAFSVGNSELGIANLLAALRVIE